MMSDKPTRGSWSARGSWALAALAGAAMLALAPHAGLTQSRDAGDDYQPAVPPADVSEQTGNKGIDRRLDRDERALRELRQIVLQAKSTGQPVEVKEAGPDPAVTELQSRFDDLDQTIRRLNGQVDNLQHDLDLSRKALADANDAVHALSARVDKLEALQAPAPPGAAAAGGGAGFGNGVLGQLPAGAAPGVADEGAAPGPADEILTYREARQTLDSGDYAGGAAALQDYLQRFPNSPRAPEANYWLGRTLALRNMQADAAAAYARSLKGWPQTPWAGDSVVRLADSLVVLNRPEDACSALGEFERRYAAKATPAVRARAREVRSHASCG